MYLVVSKTEQYQTPVCPGFDSHLKGKIWDGEIAIYRICDGKFQIAHVFPLEWRPGVGRWGMDWQDVPEQPDHR